MKMSGVLPLPASAPRHLIASSSPFPPYEWGGYWFGGQEGNDVGGHVSYEGYGIDCSGLVSIGALRAGYHWKPWRPYTATLTNEYYSRKITNLKDLQPGDILVNPDEHVVTVYGISSREADGTPNEISVIASEGNILKASYSNGVTILTGKKLFKDYLDPKIGYLARKLARH